MYNYNMYIYICYILKILARVAAGPPRPESGAKSQRMPSTHRPDVTPCFVWPAARSAAAQWPRDQRPGYQGPGTKGHGPRTRDQGPGTKGQGTKGPWDPLGVIPKLFRVDGYSEWMAVPSAWLF